MELNRVFRILSQSKDKEIQKALAKEKENIQAMRDKLSAEIGGMRQLLHSIFEEKDIISFSHPSLQTLGGDLFQLRPNWKESMNKFLKSVEEKETELSRLMRDIGSV